MMCDSYSLKFDRLWVLQMFEVWALKPLVKCHRRIKLD